ncbi:MAG: M48 family metalloprotease [Clostridia bacterium]|nr:M48 family metalloprotease [Clostridia bacterium]
MKNLLKPSNWGAIVFFILNAAVIISLFSVGGDETVAKVIIFYVISVLVALSPIGEAFLATLSGARRMSRIDMRNKMVPIVKRVYKKAKAEAPDLPKNIILKYSSDPNPNAFAVGRKTICVTQGLLELPDELIEGILAHEFGHLGLHHTDIQLIIGGGNFLISGFLFILSVIRAVCSAVASSSLFLSRGLPRLFSVLIGFFCSGCIWLWTKICMLFLMMSSRSNEYEADSFAFRIGYGNELAEALETLGGGEPSMPLTKALYSTHPPIDDRIGKLQELGVTYSKYD